MNYSVTTPPVDRGQVKWFDSKKGYGFITNAVGDDVFVHFTMIDGGGFRNLCAGDSVEFVQYQGPKGLSASQVRRTGRIACPERRNACV